MKNENIKLNPSDQRVKKVWFAILFLRPIFFLVCYFVFILKYQNTIPPGIPDIEVEQLLVVEAYLMRSIIYLFLFIPPLVYFSYIKHGTFLLLLVLGVGFFNIFRFALTIPEIYERFKMLSEYQNAVDVNAKWLLSFVKYQLFINFLWFGSYVAWVFYCYKLRLLNYKKRFNKAMANETYRNLFEALEKITEPKLLDHFYGKYVKAYPEMEKFLTKEYRKRKSELNCLGAD